MEISPVVIGGVQLEHPLMGGAGFCKNSEVARTLAESASSAILVGAITVGPRSGNEGEVYFQDPQHVFALNSLGMPNKGKLASCQMIANDIVPMAIARGKPVIVNIAGFSPEEYVELAVAVAAAGAHIIEVNLGCPNVWDNGKQHRIFSFNTYLIYQIGLALKQALPQGFPIVFKLSPYSDPVLLSEVANVIKGLKPAGLTLTNTFPNGFAWGPNRKPAITPGGGLGGTSGPALKPIALGNIRQFRDKIDPDTKIIGAGGIRTGHDMLDFLNAGASAVQVVSALFDQRVPVFGRILSEFLDIQEP